MNTFDLFTLPRWQRLCCAVVVSLVSASGLRATPDETVAVDEQMLGSSDKGFAVLRTEIESTDMYHSRTRRYLDEYVKSGDESRGVAKRAQVTLLLEITTAGDASHPDPLTAPTTTTVNSQDKTVRLADILAKYPQQPDKWNAEQIRKLSSDPARGISLRQFNALTVTAISREFFNFSEAEIADAGWTLEAVLQDADAVYLTLSADSDYSRQTRIVSLLPRRSQQLRDLIALPPTVVSAGAFTTREEAVKTAQALQRKAGESGVGALCPEIWTSSEGSGRTYHVVTPVSAADSTSDEALAVQGKSLGLRVHAQSSQDFLEKLKIPELEAGADSQKGTGAQK